MYTGPSGPVVHQGGHKPERRSWSTHAANGISMVGSPPVLGAASVGLTAFRLSRSADTGLDAWVWALVCATLAIFAPLAYVVWLLRRRQVSDIDIQRREERAKPFIASVLGAGLAWIVLLAGDAPGRLSAMAAAFLLQMLIVFGITLRWKISMHASAAASAGTVVWTLTGALLPLLILVPLVAWSRIYLRRHTLAQTVAGAVLGFSVFVVAFRLA